MTGKVTGTACGAGALHMLKRFPPFCGGIRRDLDWFMAAFRHWGTRDDARYHLFMRFQPKRKQELLDGGSLYALWKTRILWRMPILGFHQRAGDHVPDCGRFGDHAAVILSPKIVMVTPTDARLRGFRYLEPHEVPSDLETDDGGENLPDSLAQHLRNI